MLLGSRIYRATLAFLILVILTLASPLPVKAAVSTAPPGAVVVNFEVVAVKADESVTIRTKDFPLRTHFTVRMDVVGKQGINGTQVGEFDSGTGGVISATYTIPETLHGKIILALRIESVDGYTAYNWFFNENKADPLTLAQFKPEVMVHEVVKNTSVTIEAKNLPPNTLFWVRVGPYYTFYRDYTFMDSVTSSPEGTLRFPIQLPKSTKDTEYVMVRLDGAGLFVIDAFNNVDGGVTVPIQSLYKFEWCKVLYRNSLQSMMPHEEFDVIWTIQNTSNQNWDGNETVYQYMEGETMHKYKDIYKLRNDVQDGKTFDVAVDMIAPTEPGWHFTQWAIATEDNEIMCTLKMTVFVNEAPAQDE